MQNLFLVPCIENRETSKTKVEILIIFMGTRHLNRPGWARSTCTPKISSIHKYIFGRIAFDEVCIVLHIGMVAYSYSILYSEVQRVLSIIM